MGSDLAKLELNLRGAAGGIVGSAGTSVHISSVRLEPDEDAVSAFDSGCGWLGWR